MKFSLTILAGSLALALPACAFAQDDSMFSFSGFGTVGAAHSSERKADFTSDFQAEKGVGASHRTSFNPDSRLALQVDARFSDDFSAVVQVVSEYAVDDSFSPTFSLAHLKYRVSPALTVRLGRINAPFYMLSEYQRVGYATPWVRPPYEVYNYLLQMDGVEGSYGFNIGDTALALQAFYGHVDSETVDVNGFRGLGLTAEHGFSSYRASYIRGNVQYSSDSIDALFNLYNRLMPQVASRLDPREMQGSFTGLGYAYDPGNWFVRAEAIQADYAPSLAGKTVSGYVSGGYRFGKLTPSLTFAHVDVSDQNAPGALDRLGLLNQAVAQNNASRHSYTASLRWDVVESIDVKLQASHVKNHAGAYGDLANFQPGFQPGRSYNLISASVDFVF
ncbi:MAG TPA: hypothetical protein VGC74_18345 [Stenotrophomonas sp.]|jgi:hypothetical protein